MARFISGRKIETAPHEWDTLDELREFALSHGCTRAQFTYALEAMGESVSLIAAYLRRHAYLRTPLTSQSPAG